MENCPALNDNYDIMYIKIQYNSFLRHQKQLLWYKIRSR